MGFQFIHEDAWARRPSKKKQASPLSLRDIVNEGERREGACPHVPEPRPHTLVYGITPTEAADIAERNAAHATDAAGRKLRVDANVMISGVVSYPVRRRECEADSELMNEFLAFERDSIAFLIDEYGSALRSVIRHVDEEFLHLHYYVVDDLRPDGRFGVERVSKLRAARIAAKAVGATAGQQSAAYREAGREFQNRFHDAVAARHGLTRLGPGRRRLSRAQWHAEQVQARALAQALKRSAEIDQELSQKREMVRLAEEQASKALATADAARQDFAAARQKAERLRAQAVAYRERVHAWAQQQERSSLQRARALLERAEARARAMGRIGATVGSFLRGLAFVVRGRSAAAEMERQRATIQAVAETKVKKVLAVARKTVADAENRAQQARQRAAVAQNAAREAQLLIDRLTRERDRARELYADVDARLAARERREDAARAPRL